MFINAGTCIDSKGGVTIGDPAGIGEFVRIFTHTHSESNHAERTYAPVVIGDYAKIYTGAMIFPGVTIGEGAIVTKDIPPNAVVEGIAAKIIRSRKNDRLYREQLKYLAQQRRIPGRIGRAPISGGTPTSSHFRVTL